MLLVSKITDVRLFVHLNFGNMENVTLEQLAEKMKNLDFCMMITQSEDGLHARPMSNNGKVEYDGNSWFFTYEDSNKVQQINADPAVSLIYQRDDLLFIECVGTASIVRDKETMAEKWVDSLDQWFPQGVDTPGVCLVKVEASRVHFWHKDKEGAYQA